MIIHRSHHKIYVRFRRWSRKGYAVFNSLSRHITIGKICSSICDLSLQKSTSINSNQVVNTISEKELDENEDEINKFSKDDFDIRLSALFNITIQELSVVGSYSNILKIIYSPLCG